MKKTRRLTAAWATAAMIAVSFPVMAQGNRPVHHAPDWVAFGGGQEVSDATLANMRGRFASNGDLLYFGVEMVTNWQTRDGRQVTSGLVFTTDAKLHPTLTIMTQGSLTGTGQPAASTGNTTINPGGVRNVSGAAQSIQIGGIGNSVKNDVNMSLNLQAQSMPASQGGDMGAVPMTSPGTQVLSNAGASTTVAVGKDGLSLEVNVPGQGTVLQQLRSGMGLLQAAQIGGNLNLVHNVININAGLRMPTGFSSTSLRPALDSMKGMQRLGF